MSVLTYPVRMARAGWGGYNSSLQRQPLLTKTLTAAVGFSIGDIIAQLSTEPRGSYNAMRTLRMGAFGLLFAGPLQGHVWFNFLDKAWAFKVAAYVATVSRMPGSTPAAGHVRSRAYELHGCQH